MNGSNEYIEKIKNPIVLVAAIASIIAGTLELVVNILGMIVGGGFVADVLGIGGGVLPMVVNVIFSVTPYILIGVGLLITNIASKKNSISVSGIMLTRVGALIRGICMSVIFIGYSIFVAIVLLGGTIAASNLDGLGLGGYGAVVIIVFLLIFALLVMGAIASLLLSLRVSRNMKCIRNNDANFKFGGVTFSIIILVIIQVLVIIKHILPLAVADFVSGLFNLIPVGGVSFFDLGETGVIIIIRAIIDIIKIITIIAILICCMMFIKSIKSIKDKAEGEFDTLSFDSDESGVTEFLDESIEDTISLVPPILSGKIISLSGDDKDFEYPVEIGEELIIGKDAKMCSVVISTRYQKISRKHCGIRYDNVNDCYQVIDFSTNGTYINNTSRLQRGVYTTVSRGSVINLGKENISYRLD